MPLAVDSLYPRGDEPVEMKNERSGWNSATRARAWRDWPACHANQQWGVLRACFDLDYNNPGPARSGLPHAEQFLNLQISEM